jgi:hypothetical protein
MTPHVILPARQSCAHTPWAGSAVEPMTQQRMNASPRSSKQWEHKFPLHLLVGLEDLEGRDEVREGNAAVREPLLVGFGVVNEDDEVVLGALVVHLGLGSLALRHFDG